jgi:hypothetical protein
MVSKPFQTWNLHIDLKQIFQYLCPDQLWGSQSLSDYRGSFPAGKAQPGRDADHSLPFSDEVKNKLLYLLGACKAVAGQLLNTHLASVKVRNV